MTTNTSIEIVNLDFPTLKGSLKKYLQAQDQFKDYDFDGSNINVLLDVLTYNTYINSFYLNMAASEMFLDSAQLRESVASHAKELNYIPRSFKSAKATVNITVTPSSNVDSVTILKGTSFTSRVGSNTYSFVTDENISVTSTNGVFVASAVDIFEGTLVNEVFTYSSSNTTGQMVISNPTVDTDSIDVYVYEDNGANVLTYTKGTSFLGLNANSQSFFVQAARNDKYEIIFGNGTQGRSPKDGSTVVVSYRSCNGELPNGATLFAADSTIDGHSNVSVVTVYSAEGGSIHEDINSIKKNAPRFFQTQERAVTPNDYKTLLQTKYPEIQSISVYGGEDADPPQYGRVFICVDLADSDGVPAYKKQIYKDYVKELSPLSIEAVFVDPEFVYVEVLCNIKYNLNTTTLSENSLSTLIVNKILSYNENNLDNFDVSLRYSKLVKDIDDADPSIVSNQTTVTPYKQITPIVNANNTYVLNFYNALYNPYVEQSLAAHRSQDSHTVYSTTFTFENQTCRLEDDNNGSIDIVAISEGTHTRIKSIGTVDYATGKVSISDFKPSAYTTNIKVYVKPESTDIDGEKNNILKIKSTDIAVNLSGVRV